MWIKYTVLWAAAASPRQQNLLNFCAAFHLSHPLPRYKFFWHGSEVVKNSFTN
jgi:hypothetical protein